MARAISGQVLATLASLACAAEARGAEGWVFEGLAGLPVTALAAAQSRPSLTYAGTASGGVFRFDEERDTGWSAASTGLPGAPVRALAVHPFDPLRLFAGTDQGVYRSTDGGTSWEASGTGLPGSAVALAIDPVDPAIVWASARSDPAPLHLYRSADGGEQWNAVTIQGSAFGTPSFGWVVTLAFRPATSILFAGWHDVLFFTSGGQWDLHPDILSEVLSVAPDPFDASLVHIGTQGRGVASSADERSPWSFGAGVEGTVVPALAADPTTPGILYAVSGDSVFRSLDHGATWSAVGQPLTSPSGLAVASDGSAVRVATSGGVRSLKELTSTVPRRPANPVSVPRSPLLLEPRD